LEKYRRCRANTRVSWILLQLYMQLPDKKYLDAAIKNLEWTLRKIDKNRWINYCTFKLGENTYTHTIGYSLEGLIESGTLLGEAKYINISMEIAQQLLKIWKKENFMPGEFSKGWKSQVKYSCLTGNAQIARCWLRLYQITQDSRYLDGGVSLNNYTKLTIVSGSGLNWGGGGVKGSHPIYGKYMRFYFPLWAAKFLIDSLLLEFDIVKCL